VEMLLGYSKVRITDLAIINNGGTSSGFSLLLNGIIALAAECSLTLAVLAELTSDFQL
jgi:hypothetical protein